MEVAITQGGSAQVGPAQIQPYIWIVLSPFAYRLCPLLYDLDVFRIGYDVFLGSDRVPI